MVELANVETLIAVMLFPCKLISLRLLRLYKALGSMISMWLNLSIILRKGKPETKHVLRLSTLQITNLRGNEEILLLKDQQSSENVLLII